MLHVGHSRREGGWPLEQLEDWQATAAALMAGRNDRAGRRVGGWQGKKTGSDRETKSGGDGRGSDTRSRSRPRHRRGGTASGSDEGQFRRPPARQSHPTSNNKRCTQRQTTNALVGMPANCVCAPGAAANLSRGVMTSPASLAPPQAIDRIRRGSVLLPLASASSEKQPPRSATCVTLPKSVNAPPV